MHLSLEVKYKNQTFSSKNSVPTTGREGCGGDRMMSQEVHKVLLQQQDCGTV